MWIDQFWDKGKNLRKTDTRKEKDCGDDRWKETNPSLNGSCVTDQEVQRFEPRTLILKYKKSYICIAIINNYLTNNILKIVSSELLNKRLISCILTLLLVLYIDDDRCRRLGVKNYASLFRFVEFSTCLKLL